MFFDDLFPVVMTELGDRNIPSQASTGLEPATRPL
jgi:hypothetical protein